MSKSLKLKNNNYWDSKGITHNKELLSDLIPKYIKHFGKSDSDKYQISKDFNKIVSPGMYWIGSKSDYSNCPGSFGLLLVLTANWNSWTVEDQSNWIWQIFLGTDETIYIRNAVNTETFSAWKRVNYQ